MKKKTRNILKWGAIIAGSVMVYWQVDYLRKKYNSKNTQSEQKLIEN